MEIKNLNEWYKKIHIDNEKAIVNDVHEIHIDEYIRPQFLNVRHFDISLFNKLEKEFKEYIVNLINEYDLLNNYDVITRFYLIEKTLRFNLDLTMQYKFNYDFDDIQKYLKKLNSHYEYFMMLKYLEKIPKNEKFIFLPMPIETLHWLKNYYIEILKIEHNDLINKLLYSITLNNYAKKEKKLTEDYTFRNSNKSKKIFDEFTENLHKKYLQP